MSLTDVAIRNAKPREKPFKLSDSGGLFLLVTPSSKLWRFAYRFGGKQKALALGAYPVVPLSAARLLRDDAKRLLLTGRDPSVERKVQRQAANITFQMLADEYVSKVTREGLSESTLSKVRWLLDKACVSFGNRPIGDIKAPEILECLKKVETAGRYDTAIRLRSTCSRVFRFAIATARCERDPTVDLRGALVSPKVKHRAAIIEPSQIAGLLRAIDGYQGYEITAYALKLAPLVFVRPGELRHAEWSEFEFAQAEWRIPAHKMKMRRPHRVPLARQAIVILRKLRKLSGEGQYLFPSMRTSTRPISENTLNAALRRLGFGPDEMTAHGFRAMAATRLSEMGRWPDSVIDRQLAHEEENAVRRAYTRAEYWSDRIEMMQAWADYLEKLSETNKLFSLSPPSIAG